MDKNTQNTRKMVLAALLTCLGLLFPYITAHAFALAGTVLLPMHIPVLLCGFLCGPKYGGLCGLLTPVLSCMLTGMPVAYPMLPIMICELVAYGLIAGWAYQKRHFPIYPALLLAMLAGRCAYGAAFAGLLLAATGPLQALSVTAAVVTGLPGILLQLIVVPLLVRLIQKTRWGRVQGVPDIVQLLDFWEEPAVVQAKTAIKNGKAGCMVLRQGQTIWQANSRGIACLLDLYQQRPDLLDDSIVVDKIVGKAAAMVFVLGNVQAVYGQTMSVAARAYLEARGIQVGYGLCVDVINNREGNGICPMERTVWEIEDPRQGYEALQQTLLRLRSAG